MQLELENKTKLDQNNLIKVTYGKYNRDYWHQ